MVINKIEWQVYNSTLIISLKHGFLPIKNVVVNSMGHFYLPNSCKGNCIFSTVSLLFPCLEIIERQNVLGL